jgi:branched-chain amino acid transport system permease protein
MNGTPTTWLTRGIRLPLLAGALLLVVYALAAGDAYTLRLLTVAGIYALLVLGYQFIFGHAGALSLAQGAFFGFGAYVTGVLGSQYALPFMATFPLSLLLPVALAALVAGAVLRLGSHYFALATLCIAQVLLIVAINWEGVTGGANGLPGVPDIVVAGIALGRGWPVLLFVWALVALGAALAWQLSRGALGLAFALQREAPLAAGTAGLDGGALRLAAFALSALYAGAAGALYVHTLGVISPEALAFEVLVTCLAMTVIGGRTRVAGAVLGAVLLVHLPEWFRDLQAYYLVAYGAGLLLAILFAPDGLIGALERLRRHLWPEGTKLAPAPIDLAPRPSTDLREPLLRIDGLEKRYGGIAALSDLHLELHGGEIFGLIGPNGSGKTTLINLLSGVDKPDAGSIAFQGHVIAGRPAHAIARLGLARSFQTVALVESMTALDNVAVARTAMRLVRGQVAVALAAGPQDARLARARGEAMALLARMGAAEAAMRPCGDLPPGMRRRVEIARALALRPALLLLDEPAAGLLASEQADLAARLRRLRDDGLGLLLIEHNMGFLLPLADRMACLDEGRLIAAGTPDQVRNDPAVVAAYLGLPDAEEAA